MLQKTGEPRPQPQGVIARLGEHAGRQGGLSRYLNLLSDFLQQRRRVFLPQLMACRLVQLLFPRARRWQTVPRLGSSRLVSTNLFDLWVHAWRQKRALGEVIVVRYADDSAPRRRGEENVM